MKTDTTEKGLEAHFTRHLYLVNSFEERHLGNYNHVHCEDEDIIKSSKEHKQIVSHIKTETATIDTAIAKTEREIELIREYKEVMMAEAVIGKRK